MDSKPARNTKISPQALRARLGDRLQLNKSLAPFTTFNTGGAAAFFYQAGGVEEVAEAVRVAAELDLEFFVIGGGSNLLVSDAGYPGLIIRVGVGGLAVENETAVVCGAGEELMALVTFAADNSLSGMEFAAGIGGTVGGAVYGNAGAYGGEIGQVLSRAVLVSRSGEIKTVGREYFEFGYRDSHLKRSGEILVEACFQLEKGAAQQIRSKVDSILKERAAKFHPSDMCAGCFFKNIPDPNQEHGKLPAGKLLEDVGAKQMSVGDAHVSERHANIIVNAGGATSKDIRRLADNLKEKVFRQFGIKLQEEVIQIGEF
jgi:UDP-N-acetylmuramate dehydrogenase